MEFNLNKMLPKQVPDFSDLLARTIEEGSMLESLKASLAKMAAGKSWSGQVAANVRDNVSDLLDVSLIKVLIGAWNKSVLLIKYLEFKAKGFKLKIRGGEIHEIASGEFKIKADLSCGPALLWPFETENFIIPGSIKLEPPRKIGI